MQIYGQGESPMTITALGRELVADRTHPDWRSRLGSVGRAHSVVSVRILDAKPSLARANRKSADDMAIIVEDLVKLLDGIGANLKRGRYPEASHGAKIAAVLRRVADDLEG